MLLICVVRPAPPSMLQTSLRANSRLTSGATAAAAAASPPAAAAAAAVAASRQRYYVSISTPKSVSTTFGEASEPPMASRSRGTAAVGALSVPASAAISEM